MKQTILYHVTDKKNIKTIQKKGITAGMVCSEANMAGCIEDEDAWVDHEMNTEERTREVFNQILQENKPKKTYPGHEYGVFFWADDTTARYHRKAMDHKNPIGDYHIVQVYAPKIPCTCYASDFQKAEDLFQYIQDNIDDIERILNTGEEDKNDKEIIQEADKKAKQYYKTMKKWDGTKQPDKEIICPCNISKKHIVRIV